MGSPALLKISYTNNDVFIPLQPFASWTLNTTNWYWEAPLEKPAGTYYWDEELYQTDNTQGWVE